MKRAGIITTTSKFAPRVHESFSHLIPYRLELKDGDGVRKWLQELAEPEK